MAKDPDKPQEDAHQGPKKGRMARRTPGEDDFATDSSLELFEDAQPLDTPPASVPISELAHLLEEAVYEPAPAQPMDNLADLLEAQQEEPSALDILEAPLPPEKHKQKRPRRRLRDYFKLKFLILYSVLLLFLGAVGTGIFFLYTTRNDDLWLDLDTIPYRTETILYYTDLSGQTGEYFVIPCTQDKEYVPYSQIPQHLVDAFVAIEDKKFFTHHGFDLKRTIFAVANEMVHSVSGQYIGGDSGKKQGASTIDQQLIKNLTRDDADSDMGGYARKMREIARAVRMDALYSKEEIMGAYLNSISFTGNTAGVQAEARKLFGTTVDQLTIAQSASLASITRNPSRFNPRKNPEEHLERRNYVLSEMLAEGFITQAEYEAAVAEPLVLAPEQPKEPSTYVTDYFTDTVMDSVITDLARDYNLTRKEASNLLYNGGLRIYTTVVPALQADMEQVMENATYHPRPTAQVVKQLMGEDGQPLVDEKGDPVYGEVDVTPQAAMVSLGYDGAICGVVGGLGEKEISRGFNRATQAQRQVGSTMKPIGPYAVALEHNKITWSSAFMDSAVMDVEDENTGEMTPWPANVDKKYSQRDILVQEGMARSVNTVAVRVGQTAGVGNMYRFVTGDLQIQSIVPKDKDLGPLVLGSSTYGISPLDMAKAYAMFGNGGYAVTPYNYTRVTNGTGSVLLENKTATRRVIGGDTSFVMNRLLRNVLLPGGTASGWSVPGDMDSVGKTGTTSDNRDHWFIGLTPYYVTASWYGYDENLPLRVDNRNHPPTLAWRAVMQKSQQGLPYREFPTDPTVTQQEYCAQSGHIAGPNCPRDTGWFKSGYPPTGVCPIHG